MAISVAARPFFRWITVGVGALCGFAAVLSTAIAAASVPFAREGLALVKQHFGEPASTYPAQEVATLFLFVACLTALATAYCWVLARAIHPAMETRHVRSLMTLAWLMLAMHIVLFPLGDAALAVETAFKGPTSEVVMVYEVIAFLALLTMFALGQAWSETERGDSNGREAI